MCVCVCVILLSAKNTHGSSGITCQRRRRSDECLRGQKAVSCTSFCAAGAVRRCDVAGPQPRRWPDGRPLHACARVGAAAGAAQRAPSGGAGGVGAVPAAAAQRADPQRHGAPYRPAAQSQGESPCRIARPWMLRRLSTAGRGQSNREHKDDDMFSRLSLNLLTFSVAHLKMITKSRE